MPDWPTGTITFLFTDIEGSTRLWEQFPEAMRRAHARHGEIIVACVEQRRGRFIRTRGEGDSTFSVFANAADAVCAAAAFQRAFAREPWPADTPIRVRAALHTGTAHLRDGDYNSSDVNRCARLRAIAHGGQTILSESVFEQVGDAPPCGVSFADLGFHRLKDLLDPEHVWQLAHPDLRAEFPPLLSLNQFPNNLPKQLTPFIGREDDVRQVGALLAASPLVTLTGIGGTGKTRLALQVASNLLDQYLYGAWFVDLAALTRPDHVTAAVASVFGLREEPGRPLIHTLIDYLQPKRLLLVLDNCEHLAEECARLAALLLEKCSQLQILATSRAPLKVHGERLWNVLSLSCPPLKAKRGERADPMRYEAVQLFAQRAGAVLPRFTVDERNGQAVSQICRCLDGIPLAIELAAARTRILSVDQIAGRLDDRFRLLTAGSRTALPRQQTLRALIDWSYDLLPQREQALFRCLSVFVNGWSIEAVESLWTAAQGGKETSEPCTDSRSEPADGWEALELLEQLVDQSLVLKEEHNREARFRMLETIREYSADRLGEAGETERLRAWHREWFLSVAERSRACLLGPDQAECLDQLESEHDNLRAAIQSWRSAPGGAAEGLRLANALVPFWEMRGHLTEARASLMGLLEDAQQDPATREHAHALNGAGVLAWFQGDYAMARSLQERSLHAFRSLGDHAGIAAALAGLGDAEYAEGNYETAARRHSESLDIRRALDDRHGVAVNLLCLGNIAWMRADYAAARRSLEESRDLFRQIGDKRSLAAVLASLGGVADSEGDRDAASRYDTMSLAIQRELGDTINVAITLHNMAESACRRYDLDEARRLYAESLELLSALGSKQYIAHSLEGFAHLAAAEGQMRRATRLFGAAHALRERIQAPLPGNERTTYEQRICELRGAMGETSFRCAWDEGQWMTMEAAIDFAFALDSSYGDQAAR